MDLVTFDLDGTLIRTTVFQAAADGLGFGETVERYDRHFFAGVLSLEATYFLEEKLFPGHRREAVTEALAEGPWVAGIGETVQALRDRGLDVWVVTDQPDWAVAVLERWGITEGVFARTARREQEVGSVVDHVFEKWPALEAKLVRGGIPAAEVCHVGNGSNDVPIFERVGRSVAFNPSSSAVAEAADAVVESEDLRDVLDVLG